MRYLPPFSVLLRRLTVEGEGANRRVTGSYEDFLATLREILRAVEVDHHWYLQQYEDVARAITGDPAHAAKLHFTNNGYFEGRQPHPLKVDERWYLTQYPDVAESVRKGVISSGQEHFDQNGYREGRLPFEP